MRKWTLLAGAAAGSGIVLGTIAATAATMSPAEIGARLHETVWTIRSVPEPAALSIFAVVLIVLGLVTRFKRGSMRAGFRRVAAAFTSTRKRLKNGASEGT